MKKLAIIGDPVSHSHSPKIHNFISEQMKLDYRYEILETPPGTLEERIELLKSEYAGFNVTSPYKQEVMKYLDVISEKSKKYDSVNTVVNKNGKLYGYTTDADGFFMSLPDKELKGKEVVIIGAGGVVQPIAINFSERGAAVTILNRTAEKAEAIKKRLLNYGIEINTAVNQTHYDLIINSTTLGMGKNKGIMPNVDMSLIDGETVVGDMIYNPPKTLFLKEAEKRGATVFNGLGMLIYQAVLAYELFADIKLPSDMADRIFKEVFGI